MNFRYISTEKAIKFIESENKLLFAVDRMYTKNEIKDAFEKIFGVKVGKIKTFVRKNRKYAYVQLKDSKAIDLATRLGIV